MPDQKTPHEALADWSTAAADQMADYDNKASALEQVDPLLAGLAESVARMLRAFAARADEVSRRPAP